MLEAGGSDESNELIDIPLAAFSLVGSEIDWGFATVPQKEALRAHNDNRNLVPRGRVLGGTSSLNHLAYVRGSRHDYDQWAAEGCDGWAYRDVLPYFIKSEDVRAEWLKNSPYHGKGGPLAVSPGQVTDLNKYYAKAMKELGYDTVDCNGKSQIGYEPITLTVKDGSRCSTANCFLNSAIHRPNLHISTNCYVTKVLMKEKTAFGVDFIRGNRKQSVHARKEVILSAGSINSPQILMLSGIGPKKHLQSFKVVVADLPVGQNLQDHIFVPIVFFPNVSLTITPERVNTLWNVIQYKTTGKGYLSTSGLEGTSFINTDDKSSDAHANIQISFVSAFFPALDKGFATSKLNFKQEVSIKQTGINPQVGFKQKSRLG
ncbi:hypothetical protein FSP39_021537 [Pinctada imbricata]|uniref:Glucose-methanol-choline oxidoreductase N-terminal domain-containing protein n=1 Tax=Pinctada imbricata TaxID=66713 RepID=A0AA89C8F1_PINIB|nr:hypothetical protein FSP39_021537 [Pinctada imbricata]